MLVNFGQAGRHRARQLLDQCRYTRFPGLLFSGSAIFPKRFYWRALRGAPFWVAPNSRGSLVLKKKNLRGMIKIICNFLRNVAEKSEGRQAG